MSQEGILIVDQISWYQRTGTRVREKARVRGTTRGMGVDKAITPPSRDTILRKGEGISSRQDITHNPRRIRRPRGTKEGDTIKVRGTTRVRGTDREKGTNKVREIVGIKATTKITKREVRGKVKVRGKGVVGGLVRVPTHRQHHPQEGQGEGLGPMSPRPRIQHNRGAGATWDGDLLVQAVIPR